MNKPIKSLLRCLTVIIIASGLTTPAMAGMVSTDQMLEQVQTSLNRDQVLEALQRQDVQKILVAKGVDITAAEARIKAMTDAEIAVVHQEFETLPAGSGAGSVLVTVVVVFVILDIVGVTDVFSFINPIR